MESSKLKKILFKPLGLLVFIMKQLTSWYIVPFWAFSLPYFVGDESIWLSLALAAIATWGSYKLWADYNTEEDGQITMDELKKTSKKDLTE